MTQHGGIPNKCDVLVIGGGPAGTTTAGHLVKAGLDVVLIDKGLFPRPTVGESIVPQAWRLFDQLGVSEKVEKAFIKKSGGVVRWDDRITHLKFSDFGYKRPGLHVERDEFDKLLLDHVRERGVKIYENVIARQVDLSRPGGPRVKIDDRRGGADVPGEIEAKFIVDATGFSGLMSKQFNSRRALKEDKKYVSFWGYFKNARYLDAEGHSHPTSDLDTVRPATFQSKYKDGWSWHIILKDSTSVGFVFYSDHFKGMGPEEREKYFLECCANTPTLNELLKDAEYIPGSLTFRPDYSYYSETVAGDDFICVGDAAAFVDPVFSQGILGCMFHGTAGAWSISQSLLKPERKAEYMEMYRRRILGFYSAARMIALGHFGGEGVQMELAKEFVKGLPAYEVQLLYSAAYTVERGDNMKKLAEFCGVNPSPLLDQPKIHYLPRLC
ncbi:tryptophan 7-halogenase [Myxococcota bacterium]|nr:tryptophan 7-halogenase [Myxococcota bacterium]